MNPLVTLLIPFYNESEGIEYLVSELKKHLGANRLFNIEVIFIDDGSTDDSVAKLLKEDTGILNAKILKLSKNHGTHSALKAGILKSKGEYITFLPADLQDPPGLTIDLYKKISEGYDIVWAQRKSYKTTFFKKLFSGWYTYLMRKFTFPNFPEKGVDIVMFNGKIRTELNANIEGNSSLLLQILGLGFKQSYVEYDKGKRQAGQSKWTLKKRVKLLIDSFIAFSYAPIRFVTAIGILLFVVGLLFSLYLVIRKLMYNDLVSGWPMLISILMMGFGVTNISLGIIAEYLWRTLDAARKRPVFIIDEFLELDSNAK